MEPAVNKKGWNWPSRPDICTFAINEIHGLLKEPLIIGKGRSTAFYFKELVPKGGNFLYF